MVIGLEVPLARVRAFELFTDGFARWYPAEYSWSGRLLDWIGLEGHVGGACFERGPHGFRCDWGRVLVWAPPESVAFTWQIGVSRVPEPDPVRVSDIEVGFQPAGEDATRVTFSHQHFSRHGEGWEEYVAAMASPEGWPYILSRFEKAARTA